MKQIIGTKVGMTSLFDASGKLIPVTVVHCDTNKVLEVKQHEGINLVKIGYKEKAEAKNNKAHNGIFKKLDLPTMETIKTLHSSTSYNVGDDINVDLFASGEWVDVQAKTRGRGYSGAIFRWNKKIGPMGHGAGYPHRWQGSIAFGRGGSAAQRVKKGTKMAGHYGHETQTIQNLNVVSVDKENKLLLISGAIPGPKNSIVLIKSAIKPHKKTPTFNIYQNQASVEGENK